MSSRMEGEPRSSGGPRAWDAAPPELRDEALLDAFLAGELRGPDLAEFEQRLEADAELRAEADAQRRVDRSLRRVFVPADVRLPETGLVVREDQAAVQTVRDPIPASSTPASIGRTRVAVAGPKKWWGYAAAAVIVLGGATVFTRFYTHEERLPPLEAHTVYKSLSAAGWKPEFACNHGGRPARVQRATARG